jgi:glutaredoxin-related protein
MLKIYGSMLCPDCVKCREDLDNAAVEYEYLDFASDLRNLKEFLILREGPMFEQIRKSGKIGIPCIVLEDGSVKLDWEEFM